MDNSADWFSNLIKAGGEQGQPLFVKGINNFVWILGDYFEEFK